MIGAIVVIWCVGVAFSITVVIRAGNTERKRSSGTRKPVTEKQVLVHVKTVAAIVVRAFGRQRKVCGHAGRRCKSAGGVEIMPFGMLYGEAWIIKERVH